MNMLNICISLCYTGVSRALPDCLSKPNTCRACQFWWSHFFCFDKLLSDLNAESQGHPVSSSLHNHFNQKHFFLIPIQILKVFWLEGPLIHHHRVKVAPLKIKIAVSSQTLNGGKKRKNELTSSPSWFSSSLYQSLQSSHIGDNTNHVFISMVPWTLKVSKGFDHFNKFISMTHTSLHMSD